MSLTEHLARLLAHASDVDLSVPLSPLGPGDLRARAREAAAARVEDHARVRDGLTVELRRVREEQAVIANRRDEAAARARRLSAHLAECNLLLEESGELTSAADVAQRILDERRAELEDARERVAVVEDQRMAAMRAIEDAQAQLQDLESAELDETTLRRELEKAGHELREAEASHAEATGALDVIQARANERAAALEQLAQERADLVARVEAPMYDVQPLRDALAAFDAETSPEADLVAQDLAREWAEVEDELARIETALPTPPSEDQLTTAENNLSELEHVIVELEAATQHSRLHPAVREQIDAAHEAVLAAEEYLDQSGGHPQADAQLEAARVAEQQILASYGYETYLDLVMAEPEPSAAQTELLEALRARRHAEDTLASLWAATEPPQIVVTLRSRRERIYREAAELLSCDPGENVAELLYAHPVVPPNRTRELANLLSGYGVYPVGASVRDAAIDFLLQIDEEIAARQQLVEQIQQLDQEAMTLEEDEARDNEESRHLYEMVHLTTEALEISNDKVQTLERELVDRTSLDDRRLQRVAAAEQLRAQIAAVTEALERSDEEYHSTISQVEAAATAAEANLERATAALSDAVRKLRRIAEALPPALRPRASDDPLADLPNLRETLAGEVERAEVALANATSDLERVRGEIDETQASLDAHLTTTPSSDTEPDDLRQAVHQLVHPGADPLTVLDDPFADVDDDQRMDLLQALVTSASSHSVVLLTDHLDTLGWAISLPEDLGKVTGLPIDAPEAEPIEIPATVPLTDQHGAVAPRP